MNEIFRLPLPHYVILKASAGSGKTRVLTQRYVSFLLSDEVPYSSLKHILAITFSNNAAYEMKSRILGWIKDLYFKNQQTMQEFLKILSIEDDDLSFMAEKALENILSNYSDFQIKTIDSFVTSIFKASALDFDYNPDFEILMNNDAMMNYTYDLFLKDIEEQSPEIRLFRNIIEKIKKNKDNFLWDPAEEIFLKIKALYSISTANNKEFFNPELDEQRRLEAEEKIIELMQKIIEELKSSGLERNKKNQIYDSFESIIKTRNFKEILDRGISTPPVNKPKNKNLTQKYEDIILLWDEFKEIVEEYAFLYSKTFYLPYLHIFKNFQRKLNVVKQTESKIFIEDINKLLSQYINEFKVPEIYFRLGEKIHHFLIDEFQDTSPIQWSNLKLLIENALSENGSLFVVGDTKQAIYSFRGADYRIMNELEKIDIFPSAHKVVEELSVNYRSKGMILKFVEKFFKENIVNHSDYCNPAKLTGLDRYEQFSKKEYEQEGYVEVKTFYSDDEENEAKIKKDFIDIINDTRARGYSFKDIAVLALKNDHVVTISSWLNDLTLPFISYSSLDVRRRKVTFEILNLLKFLDSPVDDFSFSIFILGDLYKEFLSKCYSIKTLQPIQEFIIKNRQNSPLYKYYQVAFPSLWENHFQNMFKLTGYLPIYDLLSVALSNFKVFEIMPDEEATFLKILELVKSFEGRGLSSIKDFIEFFSNPSEDEKIWDITLGADIDAINIMTVHKAKGLGFPVVILFLEDSREKTDEYIVNEIDEETLCIMKINDKLANKCDRLKEIKDSVKVSKMADSLNTLYVAFTRAQDELYVIGKMKKESNFPFDILCNFTDKPLGSKLSKIYSLNIERKIMKIEHHSLPVEFPVSQEMIHLKEKDRGDFIHRVLSSIDFWNEEFTDIIDSNIEKINRDLRKNFDIAEIKKPILKMLDHPQMRELFIKKPDRIFFNEFEISDHKGLIHRIDRVVIDKDKVTVIEYKTGYPSEEHFGQIKKYLNLASDIYKNFTITGCLYYLDMEEIKWI